MIDEMLVAIDLLTLELGHVTDGEGVALEDEAIIFFKEDVDGTCEIRVSSPGAQTIAAKIVETWNNRPQSITPAQQTWKPRETAPKDGQTFYAMTWHGSFDGSLHWALYWNGEHFESVNNGTEYVEQFTHWTVPDVSALPSAFPSTGRGTP